MRARFHLGWAPRATALAVLVLLAALLAGEFVHTDDGCVVERHCRACRVALASAGAAASAAPPVPVLAPGEAVVPAARRSLLAGPPDSDSSRGPPPAV
jgi:hypothetical protein